MLQKKYIPIAAASEYIETLAEKYSLSDSVKDMLIYQMKSLENHYGSSLPKGDFLELISNQLNLLKTGYKKTPTDVEEFLVSPEYLNLGNTIRPKIKETLIDIFENHPEKYEIVLGGAIRTGKTYLVCCAYCYQLYLLSCLSSPQAHYKMSPGSEMLFIFQSNNERKATRNFHEFHSMVRGSNYFTEHFPLQVKSVNYALFPHNIKVTPVSTNNVAMMSQNVFSAMIDEANFLKVIKGSVHQGSDEQYYDQATQLYTTIKERIELQFGNPTNNTWPGKLYLASSANHKDDFISHKIEEAKTKKHIYVFKEPHWNVYVYDPPLSGEKFWVELPNEHHAGKILDEKPEVIDNSIVEVPEEFRESFEDDMISSLQNKAGVAVERTSKFLPVDAIKEGTANYKEYYGAEQIFTEQSININTIKNVESLLNLKFLNIISTHQAQFHIHIDMALTQDSAGVAIGSVVGSKQCMREENEDENIEPRTIEAPIYVLFGVLQIKPPEDEHGEISIEKVSMLISKLKEYLPTLRSMTCDRRYSAMLRQHARELKMSADVLSVDRHVEPYNEFRATASEGRVWLLEHEVFQEELKWLKLDIDTGKVDHPPGRSKDVADAAVGAVFKLSNLKKTYKIKGTPYTLKEMQSLQSEEASETKSRPSVYSSRPNSGNRPSNWRKKR